ncbi:hypothetical protein [Lachnobacterium bovis]|uniref:LPXTG-motif cell wall anchor domain-containing protein n=1 Tax=Lachnobacterium bovis TaxID=140626 RepID=A0A1H9PHA5_9FIRM|nr:hypothetical protein [Lachnobacterium bovis]SER47470.1 hypothetical protein SAMN02910429_00262 [Lachnobacterium bovis]
MIRGLKKKLLIGLLSAAVVGTSLAPNVPLVGSFAQEVKADDATTQSIDISATQEYNGKSVTVTKPAHTQVTLNGVSAENGTVTFNVASEDGYVLGGGFTLTHPITVDANKDIQQSSFNIGGSVSLAELKLHPTKTNTAADGITYSLDKDTLDCVTNKTAKLTITAKSGRKFATAPTVEESPNGKVTVSAVVLSADKTSATCTITAPENTPESVTTNVDLNISGGTYETLSNIKVDDTKLVGADVTVSKKEGITQDDQITVTVTPKAGYTFPDVGQNGAPTATIKGVLTGNVQVQLAPTGGKYVGTIPAKDKFKDDDLTLVVEGSGTFAAESKEEKANDKNVKTTINKKVESTAKVTTKPDGVYEAAKASGHISSELNALANATEEKALEIKTSISIPDAVDAPIVTKIKDDKLNVGYAFVITITKSISPVAGGGAHQAVEITDLGNNLVSFTISVPTEQQGKKQYAVYRMHDGLAEVISTTPNEYGEYIEVSSDTSTITLHANKFSTFAIAYGDDASVTPEEKDDPEVPDPTKEDENKPGTITPSSGTGTTATTNTAKAATSTKAAKATTSTKKSSKTSSPKTADYAVNSLLALLTGAAGLFGITLINKKRKEDEE